MTRKRRRLWLVLACGLGLGSAAALMLSAFRSDIIFFMAPSDIAAAPPAPGRVLRLGGLVEAGSLQRGQEGSTPIARFIVTDGKATINVTYAGVLPDLFREGQGVVALGQMTRDGGFRADEVLAKHDEAYMPKDVADALKRTGHWKPEEGKPPPASTWNTLEPSRSGG